MTRRIVIIGAGPAGLAAAAAAQQAANVTVIDDNPTPGGQIWRGNDIAPPANYRPNTRVISADAQVRRLLLESVDGQPSELAYDALILATGARELFLPFPGWTLPGIFGAGGLQALVKGGMPITGKRVVIAGTGPLLLAVAACLRKKGARVLLVAEQAPRAKVLRFGLRTLPGKALQTAQLAAALAGVRLLQDCWIESAEGDGKLEALRIRHRDRGFTLQADCAAVGYGLVPNSEVAALLGCRLNGRTVAVDEHQRTSIDAVYAAGEITGIAGVDRSIEEGRTAGAAAAGQVTKPTQSSAFASTLAEAFALRHELRALATPDTLVCRCEDVSLSRLRPFRSAREAKLHTRCGMGPCQGRICGPALEFLNGWPPDSVRPPLMPVQIGTLTLTAPE